MIVKRRLLLQQVKDHITNDGRISNNLKIIWILGFGSWSASGKSLVQDRYQHHQRNQDPDRRDLMLIHFFVVHDSDLLTGQAKIGVCRLLYHLFLKVIFLKLSTLTYILIFEVQIKRYLGENIFYCLSN